MKDGSCLVFGTLSGFLAKNLFLALALKRGAWWVSVKVAPLNTPTPGGYP